MRNYYKLLGISSDADSATIEEAINLLQDRDLASDASYILLNSERRSLYDHHYSVLCQIAALRQAFNLSDKGYWSSGRYSGFVVTRKTDNSGSGSSHPSDDTNRTRAPLILRLLPLILTCMLAVGFWYSITPVDNDNNPSESHNQAEEVASEDDATGTDEQSKHRHSSAEDDDALWYDTHDELPLPRNGKVWSRARNRIAPFKVNTEYTGNHTYVILVDSDTYEERVAVFVSDGNSATLKVPVGAYRLYYVTGSRWFGRDHLFGPYGEYLQADELLVFSRYGNSVTGVEVTLYRVANGNLSTSEAPKDFVDRLRTKD